MSKENSMGEEATTWQWTPMGMKKSKDGKFVLPPAKDEGEEKCICSPRICVCGHLDRDHEDQGTFTGWGNGGCTACKCKKFNCRKCSQVGTDLQAALTEKEEEIGSLENMYAGASKDRNWMAKKLIERDKRIEELEASLRVAVKADKVHVAKLKSAEAVVEELKVVALDAIDLADSIGPSGAYSLEELKCLKKDRERVRQRYEVALSAHDKEKGGYHGEEAEAPND